MSHQPLTTTKGFSMLLAFYQSVANSAGSFSESAGFYLIRTWISLKLQGTRLFWVGCQRLDHFYLLTSYQKVCLPAMGLEPTTSRSIAKRSNHWAIDALLWSYENLEYYILHAMVCLQKRKSSAVQGWWKVYIRTVNFSCMFLNPNNFFQFEF